MRPMPLLLALLLAGAFTGCGLLHSVRGPVVPRPNQQQWLDEPAVISLVTRYVYESHFDSRRSVAEKQYAARLRQWYALASSAGNFVHKIHRDAKGSEDLWKKVLGLARQPPPAGLDGLALPPEVR